MHTRRPLLLLIAILLLATGVRVYRLNEQSFWVDEFATAELARGYGFAHHELPRNVLIEHPPDLYDLDTARSLHATWSSEQTAHVPPLYQVLTRLWSEVFGLSQGSLRGMSVVVSVAAVAVLFVVVRELTGPTAALWAALLMALAGPQIEFAQEARSYALMLLEGLGAAAALVRIERHGTTRLREATLVLCVLAMALTHYFTLGAIVALAVYAAIRLRGRTLLRVGGCFALAAVAWMMLGLPLALRQAHNISDPGSTTFLSDDAPNHAIANLRRLGALPVRYFTEPMTRSLPPAAIAGGVALLLAPLLALRRRDLALWPLWLWLTILPPLALDVLRGTQHLSYIRYTLLASPALYAIVAAMLFDPREPGDPGDPRVDDDADDLASTARVRRQRWLAHVPPALVALACLVSLSAAYTAWWKADWRSLARQIDQQHQAGDVIVYLGAGGASNPNSNFLYTSFYRRRPFGPTVLMDRPPDDALTRQLERFGGMLIIAVDDNDLSSILPGMTFRRVGFEPGAAAVWRAERRREP